MIQNRIYELAFIYPFITKRAKIAGSCRLVAKVKSDASFSVSRNVLFILVTGVPFFILVSGVCRSLFSLVVCAVLYSR